MLGRTLGAYRVDAELGAGGMGRVFAATVVGRCPGLAEGTRVALKVVHPHLLASAGFFKRFLREAQIGKSVVHENVVRTFDADAVRVNEEDVHFLVMEYVEGQTLRALLEELERVPEELCRHVGRETAKGLAAIHAAGALHRDVKPDNVLVTKDHVVKVMDLGVARLADEVVRLSETGAFVGSVHYGAPEQFADGGRGVDARTDLHALGLVLYELSTGRLPYDGRDFRAIMRRVLDQKPRRPAEINPQLSAFFEELVLKLLAKDKTARFASAAEVARVLDEGESSGWWKERARTIRVETQRPLRRIRIPRETAIYGREAEMARLGSLFQRAASGDGQVVLIEGEAGIGKSRLVDEFVGRLVQSGEDVNFLYGGNPPGGAATASGAFATAYGEHFGEEGSRGWLPQTPILVPAFDALLRGESTPAGVEPLTKDSLQTVFVHATRALAAQRATIVLIDDLHFAPDEGRALFAALALAVPGHRVLLVGTTRPGLDEKWTANLERIGATRIAVQRLGPKDLVRLLADTLKSEHLATELSGRIALKSDGNPFFVFEILRGLRDGKFLAKRDDGTWATARMITEIEIPSSVLELVNARVADLDADERNLLDVAACVGFEFDPLLVAAALGMAPVPAMQKLARIEKKHRLVRSAGRRLVFDHHQVQEALYGALLEPLREAYHAAVGAALETTGGAAAKDANDVDGALAVDLCGHFLKGAQRAPTLRYFDGALAHLAKTFQNEQAVELADAALRAPDLLVGAARLKALLAVNGPLDRLGRRARQEETAREALRLAEDTHDREAQFRALYALAAIDWRRSRHREAEEGFRRVLELVRAMGNLRYEAIASGSFGLVFHDQGRFDEATEQFQRQLDLGIRLGDAHLEGVGSSNLGMLAHARGLVVESKAFTKRYLDSARKLGDKAGEATALGNMGSVLVAMGRVAEARVVHERSLALDREIGWRQGEAAALFNLGQADEEEGLVEAAEARYAACLALCRELDYRHLEAGVHCGLGAVRIERGDTASARESFAAARRVAAEIGSPSYEAYALCALAAHGGGDAGEAAAFVTSHVARIDAEVRRAARLLLWKATGDRAHLVEAKRLLDEALAGVPDDVRASMLANIRVNREIAAAT